MFTLSDTIRDMEDLANRLIKARTDRGMTQEELAKEAGVSQSTIGNLESRLRRSARKLAVIANVLGVNAYWLETGDGDPHAHSDDLLDQVAALTPAERSVVAAVVGSLRGVSVGARPDASSRAELDGLSDYENRILSLVRQLDDHGRRDAQNGLEMMVKAIKEFTSQSEQPTADSERQRSTVQGKTRLLGVAESQARRRKS